MIPLPRVGKFFVGFVLNYDILGPYNYYHIIFALIILFFPAQGIFFETVVRLLLLPVGDHQVRSDLGRSARIFRRSASGSRSFRVSSIPLCDQYCRHLHAGRGRVDSCSRARRLLQRVTFAFFLFFHLYSGILVLYIYPSITLPLLVILFGPMYRYQSPPRSKLAIAGWIFMALTPRLAACAIFGPRRPATNARREPLRDVHVRGEPRVCGDHHRLRNDLGDRFVQQGNAIIPWQHLFRYDV